MASVSASLIPETGRLFIDLTSWAGDAAFTATPVAGDQLEYPGELTVGADGVTTGPNGLHTLRHVQANGNNETISYQIGPADQTAPILSNPSLVLAGPDAVDTGVDTDESGGTLFIWLTSNATETQGDVIANGDSQAVSATGAQTRSYTGLPLSTTYYAHFVHQDASGNPSAVQTAGPVITQQLASTTAQLVVGSNRNLATLVDPIEPYLFEQWSRLPVATEQLIAQKSSGSFDQHGNFQTDLEAIFPVWFVATDGVIHYLTIDTTGLESVADLQPAPFTFTAKNSVARSLAQTSNVITVTEVDAGVDIPVEVVNGLWSKSTNAGNDWSVFTADPGTVRLNDRIQVQHTSADTYGTAVTTTLHIGPVGNRQSGTFRSTTLADTVKPTISLVGGNVTLVQGTPYVEPGYTATDNADGDLTMSVQVTGTIDENQLGAQTLAYTVADDAGNSASTTRTVTVVEYVPDDTTAPVITLVGGNITLTVGDTWSEPGYAATDNVDGVLTGQVVATGTVDTTRSGSYPITYSVSDNTGNVGTATRIVTVLPATNYPFDKPAPARRTAAVRRPATPSGFAKTFVLQAGEVMDFDFDLTDWLALEGDGIAQDSWAVTEHSASLDVQAIGQVANQDRVKVWLTANPTEEGEAVPLQLQVTTTGYRTAVFQVLMILINRMH
ncbi:DUF5011 domain-containing protein [Marinobacter sp. MDS2]|uniref:DUF5011 domain-containing protein n=1 Tax=Marinobacter sp. MDS2 TaxID=3065961 RepID=UPI00273C5CA0|nr:DUF5011 domain-containing protein [Marinobacter sp. MDS2]MDP4546495.1 DUF5011 domain-containing protein [Marinobacter sp. MDS2]